MKTEIHIKPQSKRPQTIKEARCNYELVCVYDDGRQEAKGGAVCIQDASEKRAALIALRDALKRFNRPAVIKIYIHEDFVRNMLQQQMPRRWKANNWRKIRQNGELKHKDLWQEITELTSQHAVSIAKKEELK